MYRVDGSSDLTEETLDHLEGWRGSSPVRIGNGAADQLQLDIYGEAMDAIYHADAHGLQAAHEGWTAIANMMDWLCENWDQPEEGIWETRGGRKDFTYGRFQCWVALDRAIRLAEHRGRPADIRRGGDRARPDLPAGHGARLEPQAPAFVQHYDTDVLDSSLLLMPLMGFVVAPRPDVAGHAARHGREAGVRQPGLPLRPRAPRRTGCAAARARSRCARSATSTRWPGPAGSTKPR